MKGSAGGMTLGFTYGGVWIQRGCESQSSRDRNFACLVYWFEDLVRNIERRIETVREAFHAEGGRDLPARVGDFGGTSENLYTGEMSRGEAETKIGRALARMGLDPRMASMECVGGEAAGYARVTVQLPSGRTMVKTSTQQIDAVRNLAALALWLQTRAKNFERGIETDMDRLFEGNLLEAGRGE
jgi:hypothetical protein